ncbi:MAG: transglycosylase SLT domain-containing protein [Desulfobacteraceae bacterium]|nr:transglycosylase SLT domain-containing protein [Desulfobacteraceae bacterium]
MIRFDLFIFRCIVPLLVFVFSSTGFCKELNKVALQNNIVPSLMDSIRFSGEIKFCGVTIPHENPQIRQRLEKEVLLAVHNRPQVILWIKRSARYFPHIEKILNQENLPMDLKYVPVAESALRPHSSSSKGAVGYWQFLKATGKQHGLRIDNNIDDRRNLFKSTRAACSYIKELNVQFGSYLLALCAYNMGESGLNSEIKAQENKNVFSLYLPLETQRYLFKIIAIKMILEHPEKYGFFLKSSDLYPALSFSKINFNLNTQIPIVLIAQAAKISFKTIKDMNPEVRGYLLDSGKKTLLIPVGKERGFKERFSNLYASWGEKYKPRLHVVKPGESLIRIAKHYNMSLTSLLRLNNFSFKKVIHPGDRLLLR